MSLKRQSFLFFGRPLQTSVQDSLFSIAFDGACQKGDPQHQVQVGRAAASLRPVTRSRYSTMAWMSRFSKMNPRRSAVSRTATPIMARAKSSARITWLGNNTRNAG
jgi:hypothetical protein